LSLVPTAAEIASRINWIDPATREAIYRRDGRACVYCTRTTPEVQLTLDHVVPYDLGGADAPYNLVTACRGCNADKRNMTLRTYAMHLEDWGRLPVGLVARVRTALATPAL
jgi:5-methylcytosine-specific restriction endonuclease McrA